MLRLLLVLFVACQGSSASGPTSQVREDQTTTNPAPEPHVEPLPVVERLLGGATDSEPLPLVVALHGRGSDPERFARFFEDAPFKARLLLVEAPIDEGNGRAWFSFRGKGREELSAEMRGLAAQVVRSTEIAMAQHPTIGKPVVTGFSQGAMIVYILALEHGDRYDLAVPVSGTLFGSFVPNAEVQSPPIVALHGEDDPIIPMRSGQRNLDALRRRGVDVSFHTFPEIPHWIMGAMKEKLHETLAEACVAPSEAPNATDSDTTPD
ncbi:MAG: prolyl oligopeptidase family serine peptidase [Myxococcota bacterium]